MNNTCPSCRTVLPDGATRCPACNAPVANAQAHDTGAATFMQFGTFGEIAAIQPETTGYNAPVQSSSATVMPQPSPKAFPELASFQPLPPYPGLQAPYGAPLPPALPPRRRKTLLTTLLIAVLVVLILIGSGIIYYAAIAHPAALHAQATTVAKSLATTQSKASVTAYASTPQGIYASATSGSPTINDSLNSSANSLWSTYTSNHSTCAFKNGSFYVSEQHLNYFINCEPLGSGFINMAFQVQMTLIAGDASGLTFRTSPGTDGANGYFLFLYSDGTYAILSKTNRQFTTLARNRSSAIKAGLNQTNLLTIVAKGSDIYLFINKQFVTTVSDGTYSEGHVGLCVETEITSPTTATFNNAQVWDLP